MANHGRSIVLTASNRSELERLQRTPSTPAGLSRRAQAVLLMAEGFSGVEVARRIGLCGRTGQPYPTSVCSGGSARSARSTTIRTATGHLGS